jgi:hypothetical protein
MKKIDELIAKFKEVKDDLEKQNVATPTPSSTPTPPPTSTNTSTGSSSGGTINSQIGFPFGRSDGSLDMEVLKYDQNGQWHLEKVNPNNQKAGRWKAKDDKVGLSPKEDPAKAAIVDAALGNKPALPPTPAEAPPVKTILRRRT